MSASLKLGVMLAACCTDPCACAWQASGGIIRAKQHANVRKPFTNLNPRWWDRGLLHALRRGERHGARRRRRVHAGRSILRPCDRFRLLFDSGKIESEILLLSVA